MSSRHVPPPLNLPFKYRRKSYSSDFDDRPTTSSPSLSLPSSGARPPRPWAYATASASTSASASSSPVASSPPSSAYASSPPRAHAPDRVRIRRNASPHDVCAIDADPDRTWRGALLDVDKPYSARSLTAIYGTRYAYGYAVRDDDDLPVASARGPPGFFDDLDVDPDSESSPDADDDSILVNVGADVFSPPRRRISFSTSAERDKPYAPPPTAANTKRLNSHRSKNKNKNKLSHSNTKALSASTSASASTSSSPTISPSSASTSTSPQSSSSPSSPAPTSLLPTPPASSPEERTPPLANAHTHARAPGVFSAALPPPLPFTMKTPPLASAVTAAVAALPATATTTPSPPTTTTALSPFPTTSTAATTTTAETVQTVPARTAMKTPPPERRTRSRPTLMDLLSPSPGTSYTGKTAARTESERAASYNARAGSPSVPVWGVRGRAETPPLLFASSSPAFRASSGSPFVRAGSLGSLPGSSPMKGSSPLPDSSPMKESSALPDSSPVKASSPLPDSSPIKASSPLMPSSPVMALSSPLPDEDVDVEVEEDTVMPALAAPIYTPSPSQMPLTPPSPALLPSLADERDEELDDGDEAQSRLRVEMRMGRKEISPLSLDGDGDERMGVDVEGVDEDVRVEMPVEEHVSLEGPSEEVVGIRDEAVEIEVEVEVVMEMENDGLRTVRGTPSRVRSPTPLGSRLGMEEVVVKMEGESKMEELTPALPPAEAVSTSPVEKAPTPARASPLPSPQSPPQPLPPTPTPTSPPAAQIAHGNDVVGDRETDGVADQAARPAPIQDQHTHASALPRAVGVAVRRTPSPRRTVEPAPVASSSSSRPLTPLPTVRASSSGSSSKSKSRSRPPSPPALAHFASGSPPPSLAIKREDLLFCSPLSSIASPSPRAPDRTQHHRRQQSVESSDEEEDDVLPRRPASKKRRGSKLRETEGGRKKRARTEEHEEAEDELPVHTKRKASAHRGRKSKAKSAAPDEDAEDAPPAPTDRSTSTTRARSKPARSATPHAHAPPPRKRGRRKRQRSLSSSPETHTRSARRVDWDAEAPLPLPEIEGMIIETLATARATSLSASAIYSALLASRPALKTAPRRPPPPVGRVAVDGDGDADADEEDVPVVPLALHKSDWLHLITTILARGHGTSGVFGRVDSSASDSDAGAVPHALARSMAAAAAATPAEVTHKAALLAQWFYVPEKDADRERAGVIRTMMRGPGKRSETMKYKQYYWKPLGKISRWDPEDDL